MDYFHFFQPTPIQFINQLLQGDLYVVFCQKVTPSSTAKKWQPEIRPEIHHLEIASLKNIIYNGFFVSFQVVAV